MIPDLIERPENHWPEARLTDDLQGKGLGYYSALPLSKPATAADTPTSAPCILSKRDQPKWPISTGIPQR
jgi:hypothetical protein